MKYTFDVAFLPTEVLKEHDARIVVDLLRATTQITTFFDIGGEVLIPVLEIEDAYKLKEALGEEWILMGERGGLPPEGFSFGNSPTALSQKCTSRHAIISTSNGTRAILRAAENCKNVMIGCARNAEAVANDALECGEKIGIICSGRVGEFSMEDTCCAGMIVEKLMELAQTESPEDISLTDGAKAALAIWHTMGSDISVIAHESAHGHILTELGFECDIDFAGEADRTGTVARLVMSEGVPTLVGR